MPFVIALAWLTLSTVLAPAHVYAQSGSAIVLHDAPFMLLPDATRTPLQMLPVGARLVNVRPDGQWIQGEYNDARFGRRTGYVEARFVRVEQQVQAAGARPAGSGAVTPAADTPSSAATSATPAAIGVLTDAEVDQAIMLGTTKSPDDYMVTGSPSRYRVIILGRLGRIAIAAYEAKREYKPLTVATVDPDLKRDEVMVQVIPETPQRIRTRFVVPSPVTHVVIRDASGMVTQPVTVISRPQEWGNALGGRFSSAGALARFRSIPAGDFEVVVVTTTGESVHRVRGGDRAKIQ